MVKVLIDTNVIIDAVAAREPFRAASEEVLILAAEERIEGYVTGSSVTDIYYLLQRDLGHDKSIEAIRRLLLTLHVVGVGESECFEALERGMPDFEDAVIAVCAERAGAHYIVSRDKDFANSKNAIPVLPPREFLKKLTIGS